MLQASKAETQQMHENFKFDRGLKKLFIATGAYYEGDLYIHDKDIALL